MKLGFQVPRLRRILNDKVVNQEGALKAYPTTIRGDVVIGRRVVTLKLEDLFLTLF